MNNLSNGLSYWLSQPAILLVVEALLLVLLIGLRYRKMVVLVMRSLMRNKLRTFLTALATFVMVLVVTQVWTVLYFLNQVTEEKKEDLKAIVSERWQLPSQMPYAYAAALSEGAARRPEDVRPKDYMTWTFYGGTLDPTKRTRENTVFFFALDPRKLRPMMEDLQTLDEELVQKMVLNKRGVLMGRGRLEALNKRVGERFSVTSINYKDIDLEFEIVGTLPDGRYNQSAVMNHTYLLDALDAHARKNRGVPHPMRDKSLNLVWLKVPDSEQFRRIAEQIMTSSQFSNPAVKAETASSGIASFLDAYRDLLWGMRWLLVPAILCTLALVIANAISISVRERRTEMAVLKVLGFRPSQILALVLSEALVVGVLSGFLSSGLTYVLINQLVGGVKMPIAFFPAFLVPVDALWWGPAIGAATALAGSIVPAWSAQKVKVAEVFSKVA
jgi:putative ABC transport system permease protein